MDCWDDAALLAFYRNLTADSLRGVALGTSPVATSSAESESGC